MLKKLILLCLIFIFFHSSSFAHAIIIELEKMSATDTAFLYLKLGFQHILPLGLDHILFVLSLFLLNPKLKPVLLQATAFTVAHTITLGLSMYQIINPPTRIIEPLIALSILYIALENIFSSGNKLKPARIGIVFLFGLIHGMGFASALSQLGLPKSSFFSSLLMFNIGVELGQIAVILSAYFMLAKWFADKNYYRKLIVSPISILIGVISTYWIFQRVFL